jgi:polysaccharide deacetylase family protein (PEP-CTERM system associated)
MNQKSQPVNFLSIDVEDWFHVTNYAEAISRTNWERSENRISFSLNKVLDILDYYDVRATFFVLGWVAERHPEMIKGIIDRGHEVASHGYEHGLLYNLEPGGFREDLSRGLEIVSSITGSEILGYRAPSFTVTRDTEWAYSILSKAGIRYDSSVYPLKRKRCGIPDAPLIPYDIDTPSGVIREFPIATLEVGGLRFPMGGGGYFRLFPYSVTSMAIKRLNRKGIPAVFYLHPWELDPDQPVPAGVPWRQQWKHRVNLKQTEHKFRRLCEEFAFQPLYMGLNG